MYRDETIELMEPMLPAASRAIEDLIFTLIKQASELNAVLKPRTAEAVGDVLRSMNCYYSNLIEGHNTHPRDIDRALADDLSENIEQRNLQLEAKAHIEVQRLIDQGSYPDIVSVAAICDIHRQFCTRLPADLQWVGTGELRQPLVQGEFRGGRVQVGQHIPPGPDKIARFLDRFVEVYHPSKLSKVAQVVEIEIDLDPNLFRSNFIFAI
jgi:Fic family protein